jgi:hypothetical protein
MRPHVSIAPLDLAKRRAARRRTADGGVIFVVAMTLAVLGAVGAWALQSAATEVRTAGYERQNSQTHYLSEYGAFVAMQDVNATLGPIFLTHAYCNPDTCVSAPTSGVSTAPNRMLKACVRLGTSSDVAAPLASLAGANSTTIGTPIAPYGGDAGTSTPGSLGAIAMQGDFWAELTEPTPLAGGQGNDIQNGLSFFQMTLTTGGITQQRTTSTTALYGSEGIELQRVRVVAGPLAQPNCR